MSIFDICREYDFLIRRYIGKYYERKIMKDINYRWVDGYPLTNLYVDNLDKIIGEVSINDCYGMQYIYFAKFNDQTIGKYLTREAAKNAVEDAAP